MAVIFIEETWSGRTGGSDENFLNKYTKIFRLTTDSTLDGPATVSVAVPVVRYQVYQDANGAFDLSARASSVTLSQDQDDPQQWLAVVNYQSLRLRGEPANQASRGNQEENPLKRWPVTSWGSNRWQKPTRQDIFGNAFMTSASEPLDQIMVDDSRQTLTVVRNEPSFPQDTNDQYRDTLNNATWQSWPKHTVKCLPIHGRSAFESQVSFVEITYAFEINLQFWDRQLLDAGYLELDGSGNQQPIYIKGAKPSRPQLLNGRGAQLPPLYDTSGNIIANRLVVYLPLPDCPNPNNASGNYGQNNTGYQVYRDNDFSPFNTIFFPYAS